MDGVLVDSRPAVERVWRHWARRHGLDAGKLIRSAHGRRTSDTLRELAPHLDLGAEVAWLDTAELDDRGPLHPLPGAATMVAALTGTLWAIVTSAGPVLATRRLQTAGLPLPEVLVSGTDVRTGKPSPEGYLLAAERLKVSPSDCAVMEDTPYGIAAGRAAGAQVIALTTTHPPEALVEADLIVPDLGSVRVERDGLDILLLSGAFPPAPDDR